MRRLFAWSITVLLLAFGLLWPVIFTGGGSDAAPVDDPVVITDYNMDIVVDGNGRLDAVETITADFPGGRHGIFRYWDVTNPNSPHVRQTPKIKSILLDGESVSYQMLWEDGERFRVAKIGDPDEYLRYGEHVFEIRYSIEGVLDPGNVGADRRFASSTGEPAASDSVFFWNVIAPAWNNRIQRADVSIRLPGNVAQVQCSVGYGTGAPCRDLTVTGNQVELSAQYLAPRTPVTVRAGVDVPTPSRAELPWTNKWDRVLGSSLTGVLWVAALTVAAGAAALLWYRTTVEPSPGFPLQYAPPPGLGPVQTEYIRTEAVPKNGLTATLFYLAERGLIELRQMSDQHWRVRGIAERSAWLDVDPVGVAVGSALKVMGPGTEFEAKKTVKSGQKLTKAKTDMAKAVEKWAFDNKLLAKRKKELWVRTANAIAFLFMLFGVFRWVFPTTMWALPFAAFFLLSVRSWSAGVGTRRTETGRELWSRAGGFHRLLTTDSAEARFDFGARKDLYSAYVPFAVAAGAAALWAKKYEAATGAPAPQPDWYNSSSTSGVGFVGGSRGASFDSFESALSSSIGAYTASQSSSSGSGGGSW
ncbi:DUF2207 domain-containing protein [Mycobacterium sp. IS-1556]|uniref:DUF2207 domain-containing protein n=1 Tax=Mycobacterium sp. IS-1556 TaxID=1772276 RepID=UPI000741573D|nr:DUF2207 domain-containing protein [Mycobacterium sp. IS-1556]KUH90330.1 hypothetical protein AU187_22650 [Mycobacterium sp. IS-1556]